MISAQKRRGRRRLIVGAGVATVAIAAGAGYGVHNQRTHVTRVKAKMRHPAGMANLSKREAKTVKRIVNGTRSGKPYNVSSRKNMRKWNKTQQKRYKQHMKNASPVQKETVYRRQAKAKSSVNARFGVGTGIREPYRGPRPSGFKVIKGHGLNQNRARRPNRSHLRSMV